MSLSVSDWLDLQELGLNQVLAKGSRLVSFDKYEDRAVMNRSFNEMRKICIAEKDETGEALCIAKLKASVIMLKQINPKKHKIKQKLETEINKSIY